MVFGKPPGSKVIYPEFVGSISQSLLVVPPVVPQRIFLRLPLVYSPHSLGGENLRLSSVRSKLILNLIFYLAFTGMECFGVCLDWA